MSHKNDSPKLIQNVKWSIKRLVVDLSLFLVVSIHGRPQASIAAIFRQSAGYLSFFTSFRTQGAENFLRGLIKVTEKFLLAM